MIARKAVVEAQFVDVLRRLVPSAEWLELLRVTIQNIWHTELDQLAGIREATQRQLTELRARQRRLDETFIFQHSIDRPSYEAQRDLLREQVTETEMQLSEAQVDELDVDAALSRATRVLNDASAIRFPSRTRTG